MGHQGKIYELTAPEGLSSHDVARYLSTVLEKAVTYVPIPSEVSLQSGLDSGMPAWSAQVLAELYSVFAPGDYGETNETIHIKSS